MFTQQQYDKLNLIRSRRIAALVLIIAAFSALIILSAVAGISEGFAAGHVISIILSAVFAIVATFVVETVFKKQVAGIAYKEDKCVFLTLNGETIVKNADVYKVRFVNRAFKEGAGRAAIHARINGRERIFISEATVSPLPSRRFPAEDIKEMKMHFTDAIFC